MTALAAPFLKPLDLVQVIDEASEVRSTCAPYSAPADTSSQQVHLSPHVPSELRNSHRWLQATVVNKTPYKISVERSHFHSGEYFHAPTDIAPYGQMSFSCRNSTKAGVGGATEFRVYATTDERWLYSVVFRIVRIHPSGRTRGGDVDFACAGVVLS